MSATSPGAQIGLAAQKLARGLIDNLLGLFDLWAGSWSAHRNGTKGAADSIDNRAELAAQTGCGLGLGGPAPSRHGKNLLGEFPALGETPERTLEISLNYTNVQ
jgi:hypothetical protein